MGHCSGKFCNFHSSDPLEAIASKVLMRSGVGSAAGRQLIKILLKIIPFVLIAQKFIRQKLIYAWITPIVNYALDLERNNKLW